ncbi:MAG: glycosyltransferase [Acidobacteria bacterium]|nr:glycosyltransferase [Acidobacteriota bacterium]
MLPAVRPRVLLLIPHLGGGGSERVIETLARSLDPAKYEVHMALTSAMRGKIEQFPPHVLIYELRAHRVRRSAFKLLQLIWRIKPSLILSGISHLNLMVLALRPLLPPTTRIIIRQNGALRASLHALPRILSRRAYSLGYRHADRIICQTESMARELRRCLTLTPSRLSVLPNPTDIARLRGCTHLPAGSSEFVSPLILLAIGRLVTEKGFDILLNAFASLPLSLASAQLIIVGEGPEADHLQQLAESLGVTNRVRFVGHISDPVIQFSHASLFVLSSRTEGLPNALLEAAAAGLPIVATPASPGVVHLLKQRNGVWLAANISSDALRSALEDALTSIEPGVPYAHSWVDRFDLSRAIPAYQDAMDQVLTGTAR